MNKRRFALSAFLAVAMTAAACSGADSPDDEAAGTDATPVTDSGDASDDDGGGDTLQVALAEVTSNLDPATYNVPANYVLIGGTIGYLISHPFQEFPYPELYDGDIPVVDASQYEPELATEWSFNDDASTLTMTLREGVMSPYGNELTAEDVAWTAERNVALETVGLFGMSVASIDTEEPVTVVDDYTVEWNLTGPSPLLEKVLAWSWFAPIDKEEAEAHATEDDPWATEWLTDNTAFFGPYTVTEFSPGQSVRLEANPNYWDEQPDITTVTMQTVPDAGSRQQLVQRGEVDFVPDIPRSQLVQMEGTDGIQVMYGPATRFSYLQYNVDVEPLDNELVRQAISYAVPYETIIEDAYFDTALRARTVGTWLPLADPSSSPYEYDLDKAAELLEEAGYGDGFSVDLTYSMANPGPENEQVAIRIADSLSEIGVNVNLQKPSSEAAFTSSYSEGEFEIALAGLSPGAPDTGYALFAMAHSDGYQNFGGFSDAELDELTRAAIDLPDEEDREQAIADGLARYAQVMPSTPIADPLVGVVASPEFDGLYLGSWGFPYWKLATMSSS